MVAPWISVDELEDPLSPFAQEAVDAASFVLFHLSGRKYGGVRSTTESYCQVGLDNLGHVYPSTLANSGNGARVYPTVWDGKIINQIGGCCSTCGCPHLIRLRGVPVLSVQALSVGGRSFTDDEIALFDYSYVAAGTGRCWSSCDDVEISYTYGSPPPAMGQVAARALANEYVWAVTDDDRCALPQRITQISRQGESWTLLDPQTFLSEGLTGIYRVDLFLRTVNPDRARMRARVFSPDIPRARTRRDGVSTWGTEAPALMNTMTIGAPLPTTYYTPPQPQPSAQVMTMRAPAPTTTAAATSSVPPVVAYAGRPLRWVVPGSFSGDSPPVITVRPSGTPVPDGSLVWRSSNYTLDLTAEQVSELLAASSSLAVSHADGTQGATSYPVEWRTA